jgi:hypothetical protein
MPTYAEIKNHRIIWDANPATSAVIGFSTLELTSDAIIKYGYTPDETSWKEQSVSYSNQFGEAPDVINSSFVRLTSLTPDANVFFRVCEKDQCGQHFYFKTAPASAQDFVFIAGGDTRTGHTNRQQGNALVAKIRPLFVMHGGDFTNKNNATEMRTFLDDWTLSYSKDIISKQQYHRIYPLLPTHGNHEDENYSTLCQVFGYDYNQDNKCDNYDTFGAITVADTLRVYTLNTEYQESGYSAHAKKMNAWLTNDLAATGNTIPWRIAQYHKPMFPHFSRKKDNDVIYAWWAQLFDSQKMNLVVESDTHVSKITYPVKPSNGGFEPALNGGTMYVGEGSWGAPARPADDPKTWTLDTASIQQFKVVSVFKNKLELRTAQFDGSAKALNQEQREVSGTVLPQGIHWWDTKSLGVMIPLIKNNQGKTVIDVPEGSIKIVPVVEKPPRQKKKGKGKNKNKKNKKKKQKKNPETEPVT